jgi:NADH:ubiquinone oxidoreductase subunit 6 (subunit J)
MHAQNGAGAAVFGIMLLVLLCIAAVIFLTVFWILMIVDCVKRKRMSDGERIAWILILIFLGFLGAGIYYFVVKRK